MITYIKKIIKKIINLFRKKSAPFETQKPVKNAYKPQLPQKPEPVPVWRRILQSGFIKFIPSTGAFVNDERRRRKALCRKYRISNKKLRKLEIKARRLKTTIDILLEA